MRIIAFIGDEEIIRKNLKHLGLFRSPGKIKPLIHCHGIRALSCPQPTFSARYLSPQYHEVDFGLTHKAESRVV